MVTINKKPVGYFFIVIAFLAVFLFLINNSNEVSNPHSSVMIGGTQLKVDVAKSPADQERGLSGRLNLPEGEGMLFVFDTSAKHYFWMKDMNFPIDMIFLDAESKIVYIKKNAPPESYPDTFGGEVDSMYVLEVVSGFADKHNLKIGDRAELQLLSK